MMRDSQHIALLFLKKKNRFSIKKALLLRGIKSVVTRATTNSRCPCIHQPYQFAESLPSDQKTFIKIFYFDM